MLIIILLVSFTFKVATKPVRPDVLPPALSQGGATEAPQAQPVEATNQKPQTLTPLSPSVDQAQRDALQQPGAQGGPQLLPSPQQYMWAPLGGSPMMIPLQPGFHEALAPPQQPLVFSPYGYFPVLFSPYGNQQFSPYSFPTLREAPIPQTPSNQSPNSPLSPAETPAAAAAPLGDAPQPIPQNAQIVYMLQQPMSSPLGSSSEELETPVKMGHLDFYMPNVLTNLPVGAVQPVNPAAGLANPEQQGTAPNGGSPSAGVPQTQGLASSGPQANTNRVLAGLEKAAQATTTVQTPVQPKLQPRSGNLAQGCSHQ
ncbi:hypothetical protein Q5P01_025264 [Channa striata]|uniref:Uncharacterized protein n=1 Tax=Channa striata TaxID=64152 RepID=A0AA88IQL0_CHASR|nr:hypothetical protein Q5P01_025264 [Channa striata]